MTPDHPSSPPGPETFAGIGLCFEMEVGDAKAAHDELIERGLPVTYPLTDEPFGQRRFDLKTLRAYGLILSSKSNRETTSGANT